eukprot:TRINITY_DN13025_c0_g1_i1.p1 TRINITY_DN13025_c0_g1~~TRINITY_DN13025_c0_g1_i1.p1  ORF type:complete len:285 (-),score=35.04 TRINITY_DN13025_c0_g1_i1:197-1051(-)
MASGSQQLRRLLKKKLGGDITQETQEEKENQPSPVPKLPSAASLSFLDMDPAEVARQICLIDQRIYRSITLREFLNQSWNKDQREITAPNITASIRQFNDLSEWVRTTIVREIDRKKRIKILDRMIQVANKCFEFKDFNALMSILAGLNSTSVHRLKKTWEGIEDKSRTMYSEVSTIMASDRNFTTYREYLHTTNPPCVPYLGIYLTDLTFIGDGTPERLKSGAINFAKHKKISGIIREIQQYQHIPYPFKSVASIQSQLVADVSKNKLTEPICFQISLLLEPR